MAVITQSIGSAGGRDFTTIQAWFAAIPADVVASGNSYVGELYNDSEFTTTSTLSFTGKTCSATNTITLRAAAGQSYRDHAAVLTNALRYDASKGVGIRKTSAYASAVSLNQAYMTVQGIQFKHMGGGGDPRVIDADSPTAIWEGCIVENGGSMWFGPANINSGTFRNCTIINRQLGKSAVRSSYAPGATYQNCTFVTPADVGNTAGVFFGQPGNLSLTNCAFFGFGGFGAGTFSGSNNASDLAIPFGTNNQASLLFADQFENVQNATADFRLKSTSALVNAGTAIGDNTTSASGKTRPQGGLYDIGSWEVGIADAVPGAPTNVVASGGTNGMASIAFTAPASNGGKAITSYIATASTGQTASGSGSPIAFAGLPAGAKTFTVAAINEIGTGPASAASNSITVTVDSVAPTVVSVEVSNVLKAGAPGMLVTFSEPIGSGVDASRFALTGHTLAASPVTSDSTLLFGVGETFTNSETPTLAYTQGTGGVLDLAGNQLVAFTGMAVNNTSGATVPNAPTNVIATPSDGSVSVAFTAPASNGGKPITGYKVTASTGQTATGTASPIVVTMPNGVVASFTVEAINALGSSTASNPSSSVAAATAGDSTTVIGGINVLVRGIGAGKTFANLAAFATYIRGINCIDANSRIIGEIYEDQVAVNADLHPLATDASRCVILRPAAAKALTGYSYNTSGVELTVSTGQYDRFSFGYGVTITGLRINIPVGARYLFNGTGAGPQPTTVACRILANGNDGIQCGNYAEGELTDSLIVRRLASGGKMTSLGWRLKQRRNTYALEGAGTASSAAANTWNGLVENCVFYGFADPILDSNTVSCINNYTNVTPTNPNGLIVDTTNAFFVAAGTDYRAGIALRDKGNDNAKSINDGFGANRGPFPDVGAFDFEPAIPLATGALSSLTVDGQSVTVALTTTGTVGAARISIAPASPSNGAAGVGPLDMTLGANTATITIDDMAGGNYAAPVVTLSNDGGMTYASGAQPFEIMGVGNLVYDGGGVGTGGGGTDPVPTLPAPTVSIATADNAIMAGKRATVSGAVNLNGDANGTVNVFLDPQPSGTPASLGAATVTTGTWTKQADIPPGLYKLRVVAEAAGQSATASTVAIRVLNLIGNFSLPTA